MLARFYNRPDTLKALRALSQEARGVLAEKKLPPALAAEVDHCIELAEKHLQSFSLKKMNRVLLYLRVILDKVIVDVDKVTIEDLQKMVRKQQLSYRKLTEIYLNRIAYYDHFGIRLNAIRSLNNTALEEAALCDQAVAKYKNLAQGVFGMPVLIKDNINTDCKLDGMPTTMGSIAFANNFVEEDAFIIQRLRDQGAIILGKTNLSEFAKFLTDGVRRINGSLEPMPQGYSSLAGQVVSPYRVSFNPGGSSTGSCVACAAALSALTVGTEATNSILMPATRNSVVGMKPTAGLLSRRGVLASTMGTAGPIGRSVTDVAYLLEAMKGFDKEEGRYKDQADWQQHTQYYPGYLVKEGLEGKRIGIYLEPSVTNENDIYTIYEGLLATLKDLGATVVIEKNGFVHQLEADKPKDVLDRKVLTKEFTQAITDYLKGLKNHNISMDKTPIKSIRDIVEYNRCYPERIIYGQSILELCAAYVPSAKEEEAPGRIWGRQAMDRLFEEQQLDALVSINGAAAGVAAKAGYPSIVVPVGYGDEDNEHEPISLMFTGKPFQDGPLIAMAYSLEQATKARRAPGMADKRLLQELLEELDAMGSWSDAYNRAHRVFESNFATQAEVDEASESLLYHLM